MTVPDAVAPTFGRPLARSDTTIPGLLLFDIPVHGDARGWFKENWQREKMNAAGLPDFGPIQNNVSFNDPVGTTRGIHAEPWDKLVSVVSGRVFGAWVDLREGLTFGRVYTAELDASQAMFVPRGVGNSFQTLEPGTVYSYLVNDHWTSDADYPALNLADETVAIPWPIRLRDARVSAKDLSHPRLDAIVPMSPLKILVLGAGGQLGRALRAEFGDAPHLEYAAQSDFDLTSSVADARRWRDYACIVNAAGFTAVDLAETPDGRREAWAVNAAGAAALAAAATVNGLTLVHVSTDYVFDGSAPRPYLEDDAVCPLGVYGQTKAAGDAAVAIVPRHYLVRTSWVVGDGANFVRTMASLAERGVDPQVVDDQVGRLTFANELARGIRHLLDDEAPYGTYNITGSGHPSSWAGIAQRIFLRLGHDPARVDPVTTTEYEAQSARPVAARPANSVLDLSKIAATGWTPRDHLDVLDEYIRALAGG